MAKLTNNEFALMKDSFRQFSESIEQETITWFRSDGGDYDRFGEDPPKPTPEVALLGLIQYNYFRSWPITKETNTGELDQQNIMVYLNKEILEEGNFLNADGYFQFDRGYDRFEIRGISYKAVGDTEASQNKDGVLFQTLIMRRENLKS